MNQRIRFCQTPSGQVAYAIIGAGPLLLCDTGWIGHLEYSWNQAPYRAFFERLGASHTVVRYDKLGTGLSDRARSDITIEADVQAMVSILGALGDHPAGIFASSQGGPAALTLAARHPDRVSKLVLYGTYANGAGIGTPESREALVALLTAAWGRMTARFMADILIDGADEATVESFIGLQRVAADAVTGPMLLAQFYRTDVGAVLGSVKAPTLVIHRKHDRAIAFALGRDLAARIGGSQFVPLEGTIHIPFFGDSGSVLDVMEEFLAAPAPGTGTTVLTDRERRVAELVAEGLTNAEIARTLSVAPRTADAHLEHIRNKLGVHSRAQIAAWATRQESPR